MKKQFLKFETAGSVVVVMTKHIESIEYNSNKQEMIIILHNEDYYINKVSEEVYVQVMQSILGSDFIC